MALITCNLYSQVLKRAVDIDIVLPTITLPESMSLSESSLDHQLLSYDHRKGFPIVYLLHGFGNNQHQWLGYTNIELFAEERNICIVIFSAENKKYLNTESDEFERFIQEELPDFMTNSFPVSKRREDTYIAGLSMGGFGALYHGLAKPEQYAAIGAFSPALNMAGVTVDLFQRVAQLTEFKQKIFLSCGTEDFLYEDNLKMKNLLIQKEADLTWQPAEGFKHEWRFWNQTVEAFLDWLPRTDAFADHKRSV